LRRRNFSEGERLAFLSAKHGVSSDRLFQALASTGERQKTVCGNLSVECRGRSGDNRIFLMREGANIVAQIKLGEAFLSATANPISRFDDSERIRGYEAKRQASVFKQSVIGDLRAGMTNVGLRAKVLEVGLPSAIFTRFGNQSMVANALIGDDTGTIQLSLWGEQIESVSVGDVVQIVNGKTLFFKGKKQVRIGKNGSLKVEYHG
jgi:Single-stranded DNA binding protein Ssb-like, OB fold